MVAPYVEAVSLVIKSKSEESHEPFYKLVALVGARDKLGLRGLGKVLKVRDNGIFDYIGIVIEQKRHIKGVGVDKNGQDGDEYKMAN
jgi:hypothetical protein